jgi:predicted DNA-binding antitoxin AbrB/MazE fold protein
MQDIEVIYRQGFFEPLGPVELPEGQRVRLTIQRVEPFSKEEMEAWMQRVQARREEIAKRNGILFDSTAEIAADRLRNV